MFPNELLYNQICANLHTFIVQNIIFLTQSEKFLQRDIILS